MVISSPHRTARASKGTSEHLGEDVVGVRGKSVWISLGRAEPVKVLALLWVAQDLIGLLDLFKLLRVTAFVWVVLSGKFAIGFLDVVSRRLFGQT
jgi:hypothetical protein